LYVCPSRYQIRAIDTVVTIMLSVTNRSPPHPPSSHSQVHCYVKNVVNQPQLMLLVIGELLEFSPFKSVMTTDNLNLVVYGEA
jgi:hypothetical protein